MKSSAASIPDSKPSWSSSWQTGQRPLPVPLLTTSCGGGLLRHPPGLRYLGSLCWNRRREAPQLCTAPDTGTRTDGGHQAQGGRCPSQLAWGRAGVGQLPPAPLQQAVPPPPPPRGTGTPWGPSQQGLQRASAREGAWSCSDSTQHGARGPRRAAGTPPSLLANPPLSLQVRTADMGGYATSLDFTQAVIAALDV